MFERLKARFPRLASAARGAVEGLIGAKPPAADAPDMVSDQTKAEVANNDNVVLSKIKSTGRTPEGWATIGGAIATIITFYGGDILPAPVAGAINSIGEWLGLPPKLGSAFVIAGTFVFLFVRKKFFAHTISPEAADRAIAKGKAV